MSRLAVRSIIRTELEKWANANANKFYDTIDDYNKITDAEWFTVEFFSDYTEKLCYSAKNMKETGTIEVTVFVYAGQGDAAAVATCDDIQDYLFSLDMGDLTITDTTSAAEINLGDGSGRYYGCMISLNYDFFY